MTRAARSALGVIAFAAMMVWLVSRPPTGPDSGAQPVPHRPVPTSGVYYGPDGKEAAPPTPVAAKPARRRPSRPARPAHWYTGGTLHQRTIRAWNAAPYRDRLATSADFVGSTVKKGDYKTVPMRELRKAATELEICISIAAEPQTPAIPGHMGMEVAEFAAVCIMLGAAR